jgi:hypothetical protein
MAEGGDVGHPGGLLAKLAQLRKPSLTVAAAGGRVDGAALRVYLAGLGEDEVRARSLIEAVDTTMGSVRSLSSLTSPVALEYLDRLARPIPTLTAEAGVQIVTRSYVAHLVVERQPSAFGVTDVPVLGTLPPLRRGSPPQDLSTRVVKASRRNFELIRAVSNPVWEGFVRDLTRRAHDQAPEVAPDQLLDLPVVDGLARFGWVLRQVDLHYGLEPERG